jgi:NAD-dependent deacetylase
VPIALHLDDGDRLLVLTGAGCSAESGIPTYRGTGGLWGQHRFEVLASPEGFAADPALVWRFYSERRQGVLRCEPNAAHLAIAAIEARLGERFLLATQNVDGLHQRAGSSRVVELHGSLLRTRCSRCDRPAFDDRTLHASVPTCECGARLRPDVVWFGERLEPTHLHAVERFMAQPGRLTFLAVGTSGAVWPAAGMVQSAKARGADTWLVNVGGADNASAFDHVLDEPAGTALQRVLGCGVCSAP